MKKHTLIALGAVATVLLSATAGAMTMQQFTDQGNFAAWFAPSVEKMQYNKIINGYPDGSFGPDKGVSRAELAVMLDRFATAMGQELDAGPRACTMQYVYGLTVHVQDEKGQPLEGAAVGADDRPEEVMGMNGTYALLGEAPGTHTVSVSKEGYSTHLETVVLESDGCHVIPQVRTVTLYALEEPMDMEEEEEEMME